jgi:type VII secretion integral membrane protein EccD
MAPGHEGRTRVSTAINTALCRISVVGPDRKADLAVPVTTPVASLLPIFLWHTMQSTQHLDGDSPEATWVLQRLGQTPFDLSGTPETLDWLEGEELHLRPAENPLPELDFDDLADGVATMVNRRSDRWQPEYRRISFLLLASVCAIAIGVVIVDRGPVLPQVVAAGVLSAACLAAALITARRKIDSGVVYFFTFSAGGFGALSASSAVDNNPEGIGWSSPAAVAAALTLLAVFGTLLVLQRTVLPALPFIPMLTGVATVVGILLAILMQYTMSMTVQGTAATAVVVFVALVTIAPRAAVKFARLRGPQLPKTSEDMSYDIEPAAAEQVRKLTDDADRYMTVVMIASVILLPVLFHFVMSFRGWAGWVLVLMAASVLLLRARTFLGVWQRGGLVVAGTTGYVMVVLHFSGVADQAGRLWLVAGMVALLVPLLMAALRPWPRRLLPFWEYTATFLDVATAVAIVPVLAQILGVYAWARGLFG